MNNVNDFKLTHPKLYACVHHSVEFLAWGITGALVGGAYGLLFKAEPILTAQIAAIHFVAGYIFEEANKAVTGDPKKEPKKFYMVQLVGEVFIQTIALLAYRHFNIIGNLGTGIFALYMLTRVSENLDRSNLKLAEDKEFEKATKEVEEELDQVEEVQKKDEPRQQEPPKDIPPENKQPEGLLPVQS